MDRRPPRRGWESEGPRRRRPWVVLLSVGAHLLVGLALALAPRAPPAARFDPDPIPFTVVQARHLAPSPAPPAATAPAPATAAQAPTIRAVVRPVPADLNVKPLLIAETEEVPAADPVIALSEAELGRARTAGSGGGGGGSGTGAGGGRCDMVQWLETELRKAPRVRAAVAEAHRVAGVDSRAVMVWNGDWIRGPGQEGKGYAGVREALAMEIAFAPAACRADPMRGLVLISLGDGPGAVGLAFGTTEWRWSDMLIAR